MLISHHKPPNTTMTWFVSCVRSFLSCVSPQGLVEGKFANKRGMPENLGTIGTPLVPPPAHL